MKEIEYDSDEMYEKYKLTDEQIRACKQVFKAMRKAGQLGVQFWDMYGTLTAYNGHVFSRLHMFAAPNSVEVTDNCEANELLLSRTFR